MNWRTPEPPLIIGHRGASWKAPENTLAAFALAQSQGADGIELDVRLSADRQVVVIHDATVDRTTDGSGAVARMSLPEIQELDAGQGLSIPSLDDVFQAFGPGLLYNVELKDLALRGGELEFAVADRIAAYHLEQHVVVSSFNPLAVRRARRELTRSTMVALLRQPGWQQYAYLLASGEADHPHWQLVDESYMVWAQRRNYRVHVWTVDDEAVARRVTSLGAHAIITNQPERIRASLASL